VTTVLPGELIGDWSVRVLKEGQAPSGALVACPTYPTYRYAWLRDGAFCAHALDVVGERDAAVAWHRWVAASVEAHRALIETAVAGVAAGRELPPEAFPPARYTLEGRLEGEPEDDEPWPNFQIDGYGMWLWALERHLAGAPDESLGRTVELVARYLEATWRLPSFSCWEELDGGQHGATHGSVAAGLAAAGRLLGDGRWSRAADAVRDDLLVRFGHDGRLGRGPGDARVDGSLIWLGVPFGVLAEDDPVLLATIGAVESDLCGPGGGVYRYLGDTYYGGGQWLLLTSSLAWHHARTGNTGRAAELQEWVRAQARPSGDLPEQVTGRSQAPPFIGEWVERWGPVATPLLWSHAMYLLAEQELAR
jgi:GH15 family glucan-1,4-alpha-glucosidase